MARKKRKKINWVDALTGAAKAIADGAAKSGGKANEKSRRQKAECGGCD